LDETVAQAPNPAPRRDGLLATVTAGAVAVEGLLLFAVAVRLSVEAAPVDPGGKVAEVALSVLCGLGLLGCAWAVYRGRRWPRGLLLTWQLLQAAVAIPALGERWAIGVGLLLLSAVVIVGLVRAPGPAGPEAG
jgi:hypothetical protein